ncbi:MAG: translation initiation factor IF-2 [Candidatus Woesearchaeota archaeon]|jgi:translation initiation factor 5B
MLRKLIVTFLGHVDHGKTSLQDYIRNSSVCDREAGAITQHVGASTVPLSVIKSICGDMLLSLKMDLKFDGLLCIDTPGHAAFTSLRKRGGNLADIAVLVIDINQGIQPQTIEAVEILKNYKTPFIIAANKIDTISGWRINQKTPVLKDVAMQEQRTITVFETKLYEIVGKLFEHGFEADRFDRVSDFTKQIAIVPTSAKSGEGMPELILMLAGLSQKYLEEKLADSDISHDAHGTILEIKEMQGVGTIMDVILYDGTLKLGDTIVIGGIDTPIVSKVKALFEPNDMQDMRDKKSKYQNVDEVSAACGVRVSAVDIENVVSGMPVMSCTEDKIEETKELVQSEVDEVVFDTETNGIIIKADTLGSLEALVKLLQEKKIPIRHASVGKITKKDLMDAHGNYEKDPLTAVILGFNIDIMPEAKDFHKETLVHVMTNSVIYRLIEEYELWKSTEQKKMNLQRMSQLPSVCKIQVLKQFIFRQSTPFVCGVEVISGVLRANSPLMNSEGNQSTILKSMEHEKKSIHTAEKGMQVAASFPNLVYKRSVNDGDVFYSLLTEEQFRKFKEYKDLLDESTKNLLKEIAEIMRKSNPTWAI